MGRRGKPRGTRRGWGATPPPPSPCPGPPPVSMSPLMSVSPPSWAFLEVTTNASYSDSLQAYAAGLAEAAVSEQVKGVTPSQIRVLRGTARSLPPADPRR